MKYLLLFLCFLSTFFVWAQEDSIPPVQFRQDTTLRSRPLPPSKDRDTTAAIPISIKDYRIITASLDTTYVDTTLTIHKDYRFNYLRSDSFELMPFSNVGQPYNRLGRQFSEVSRYPRIGAGAKHYNYLETEDIRYYNVPTPMTELFFKTTFEQGQMLDALLTLNTSRRLNFTIAYKGFRSLGKYQANQAQSGNFRFSTNYLSPGERYLMLAHIAMQDIETEENGGLESPELQFISEDPEFSDRSRIDVRFQDAESRLNGKRYFLDHRFAMIGKAGVLRGKRPASLMMTHRLEYETKYYQYQQDDQADFFGPVIETPINDKATLKTMTNRLGAAWVNPVLGEVEAFTSVYHYNYFFNSLLLTDDGQVDSQLKGEEISMGGAYRNRLGGFDIKGEAAYTVSGDLSDYTFNGSAGYNFNPEHGLQLGLHLSSRMPDFNTLLYQSEYLNYNWQHTEDFDFERRNVLKFEYRSPWIDRIEASYSTIDNYTYFTSTASEAEREAGETEALISPLQAGDAVYHYRLRVDKEFKVGKWALANSVLYQGVPDGGSVLNVPELLTRNTLYYSSDVFDKAMFLQTGVTFKYFTEYTMDAYNPVLGEFYVQEEETLGGYPMLDFFINARIRQTRIFLKAEHFNSSFTGSEFFSAPLYPYRDFVIRFGLVWNFFS